MLKKNGLETAEMLNVRNVKCFWTTGTKEQNKIKKQQI